MRHFALAVTMMVAGGVEAQQKKGDLAADVARLQQEVALHRQVLTNLLQEEQQRGALLLQLLNSSRGGGAVSLAPMSPDSAALDDAPASSTTSVTAPRASARRASNGRSVSGRVTATDGTPVPEGSWVYVQDVSAPAKGAVLEIRQHNKTFVPSATVVQRGTQLVFTNADVVFHDVFSHSPTNPFEIGAIRGGTKPQPVTMSRPGVVDVFCNFHSKMNAQIMVVPGPLFTKADDQGNFKLENVPPGRHTIGAWSPNAKPVSTTVDVAADVGGVELNLSPEREPRPHLNKSDRAYGSYEP